MSSKGVEKGGSIGGAAGAAGAAAVALGMQASQTPPPQFTVQPSPRVFHPSESAQPGPEQIQAMIEASEARGDARLANALADLKVSLAQFQGEIRGDLTAIRAAMVGKTTFVTFSIGTALGLFAALIAALAYGGQLFGLGLDTSSRIEAALQRPAPVPTSPPSSPPVAPSK